MPYPDELFEASRSLASEALIIAREILPSMGEISKYENWTSQQRRAVTYLLSATARATESGLLLCAHAQLWDAEVVVRTVAEGSLKFCYLLQRRDTFDQRCEEYQTTLFNLASVRDQERMQTVLKVVPKPDDPILEPMRRFAFSEDQKNEIRRSITKTKQRELESRWSFTGIVRELISSKDPLFENVLVLSHAYAMASHLAHMDYAGTSMPFDRDLRAAARLSKMHMAHAVRLTCDTLSFLLFRMVAGYRFAGADEKPLAAAQERVGAFAQKYEPVEREWVRDEYGLP